MRVAGCTALVTGANRGIGAGFARVLLQRGAAKIYAAARDPASVSVREARPLTLDITSPESVAATAEIAGDVTLLINNAGVANAQELIGGDIAAIRHETETNVFGTLAMVRAFAPILARNGGGAIINVLSAASWFSYPGHTSYAVSKAAQWSLTTGIRMELAAQGTQVVGAHVFLVDTDMTVGIEAEKLSADEFADITLDGLEAGKIEVLADELTERAKAAVVDAPGSFAP